MKNLNLALVLTILACDPVAGGTSPTDTGGAAVCTDPGVTLQVVDGRGAPFAPDKVRYSVLRLEDEGLVEDAYIADCASLECTSFQLGCGGDVGYYFIRAERLTAECLLIAETSAVVEAPGEGLRTTIVLQDCDPEYTTGTAG
jgi:hypothetical protein